MADTDKYVTPQIATVLQKKSIPGITFWNRLEGRPRAENFDRALRAEVRDALWMLTRQWQMDEFRGDDAGSPIFAKVRIDTTRIRTYQPGPPGAAAPVEPFDDGTPLETRVERLPIPFVQGGRDMALDIRLLMGRYWLKLIDRLAPGVPAVRAEYIARYPVHTPDPLQPADAPTCAHQEAWSACAAAATRLMDGAKLYFHLTKNAGHASDGIASLAGLEAQADGLGDRFIAWFDRLIAQPPASPERGSAWEPDRLEYQFSCSAPLAAQGREPRRQKVLVAEEYFQGHLDWYNLDVDPSRSVPGDRGGPSEGDDARESHTLTMMPTQVTFNGMPNTRWWAFEDGRTNFGDIKPDTTDLAKLLLIEFGLVYANDWFLIPFTVPAGTIANIRGLAVTNVFGERLWIEAAGGGEDDDWQRWAMFLLSVKGTGDTPADLSLVILPAAQKVLEGRPLEEVMLARDEMANMVWGIEKIIPLPSGEPKHGIEAAYETRAFFLRDFVRRHGHPPEPPPFAEGAKIRYQVMSTVPENWIPMIPVHVADDNREVQLQRAAMARILEGDTVDGHPVDPVPIRPRTPLLRVGLDAEGGPKAYFLHEEEVPRAGVRVTGAFQRTRWRDGRAWVWLGVRKQTGRGEGSSGLAFDRIIDEPPPT